MGEVLALAVGYFLGRTCHDKIVAGFKTTKTIFKKALEESVK